MKSYYQYLKEQEQLEPINEGLVTDIRSKLTSNDIKIIEANLDRKIGDSALSIKGEEIKGSVILYKHEKSSLSISYKDGGRYHIEVFSIVKGFAVMELSAEEFNLLKKVK